MVWRGTIGTEKLRIGELAEKTGITRRTIDYYTNLGLLEAERSGSNYRYYSTEAIQQLHEIELKKAEGLSLEEIRQQLNKKSIDVEEIDIYELRLQMQQLEKNVSRLLTKLDNEEQNDQQSVKKKMSRESITLVQSLLLIIP